MLRSKPVLALLFAVGALSAFGPSARAEAQGQPKESIHVTVVGKVQTGVFAIGGETTGTLIRAKGITWELDLGRDAKLRKAVESLNGRLARVTGSLERRKGVEIGERWIVTVESLAPAGKPSKPKR